MIHSSRRDSKTKAIAEVLAMIADAIGRAFRWRKLFETGTHSTVAEIAAAEKINTGIVTPLRACGPAGGSVAKGMKKISYRGYRFPPEIIQQAIWLYLRFTLSLRDVEDLLSERGIMVSYFRHRDSSDEE